MGETGDLYRELRTEAAEKRRRNLASSTKILREAGIAFESRNDGLHLIIRTAKGTVNFWPSTGKYNGMIIEKDGVRSCDGRGVFNLLEELKELEVMK